MTTRHAIARSRRWALALGLPLIAVTAAWSAAERRLAPDPSDQRVERIELDPATATAEYVYHDVALAPEYHRSYRLTVREGTAHLVVFTYDEALHELDVAIDDEEWREVRHDVEALAGAASVVNDDCAGGSAEELTAVDGRGMEVVHVFIDHCNASGGADVRQPFADILGRFDLSALLATD
jgi:hypothetical protein